MALYSQSYKPNYRSKEHSQKVPGTISFLIAAETVFNYNTEIINLLFSLYYLLRLKIWNKLREKKRVLGIIPTVWSVNKIKHIGAWNIIYHIKN